MAADKPGARGMLCWGQAGMAAFKAGIAGKRPFYVAVLLLGHPTFNRSSAICSGELIGRGHRLVHAVSV